MTHLLRPAARFRATRHVAILLLLAVSAHASAPGAGRIVTGDYVPPEEEGDDPQVLNATWVNLLLGAGFFYDRNFLGQLATVANVEAGHIWGGHGYFDRSLINLPSSPAFTVHGERGETQLGSLDGHATAVSHVMAGTGLFEQDGEVYYGAYGMGMAPRATLGSGAIATSFDEGTAFTTNSASFRVPYLAFFEGTESIPRADVINSSWGIIDPAGTAGYTRVIDGLAAAHPTVTFVTAAGNSGPAASTLGGMGTGFHGINVGALGGHDDPVPFMTPSTFSSAGPADFYNPVTEQTVAGVRAAVHLAAPGERFIAAAYPGEPGVLPEDADPNLDPWAVYVNANGTSFAAPLVAGGIALLKDMALEPGVFENSLEARDTRVIRSVLMASALPTVGWDNAQAIDAEGVLRTSQSLDFVVGAGRMDLRHAADVYVFGTTGGVQPDGDPVALAGWDLATIAPGGANDYTFAITIPEDMELAASLNWFTGRDFDSEVADGDQPDDAFADLDLEVWAVTEEGVFDTLVAASSSAYNNSEFLRFALPGVGRYGLRVRFTDWVYLADGNEEPDTVTYGLAWSVVPEPSSTVLILAVTLIALGIRRIRQRTLPSF